MRLAVTGELDLANVGELENRLHQLRAENAHVELDLSGLDFMDAAGLRVLAGAMASAAEDHWLEIEPRLSPQVERLFALIRYEPPFDQLRTSTGEAA
jgi:anti-anti-sigma factor